MSDVLSLVVVYVLIGAALRLESTWQLSRYYISPPLLAGAAGSLLLLTTDPWLFEWAPSESFTTGLVTCFLFTIGFQMGRMYTLRYYGRLFTILFLSVLLLLGLEGMVWMLFHDGLHQQLLGTSTFAWNPEWMERFRDSFPGQPVLSGYEFISLWMVFMLTPIVLRLMSPFHSKPPSASAPAVQWTRWNMGVAGGVVLISWLSMELKSMWFMHSLYIFEFVISMTIGWVCGLVYRYRLSGKLQAGQSQRLLLTIKGMGTLSLYGFIVTMLMLSAGVLRQEGELWMVSLLLLKGLIISLLIIWIARKTVRRPAQFVWLGACWAFVLSAPVACMNVMRTIVERDGEANEVLLVVPPVILWLVNYPHEWIFRWIYG
ncbi:hypothetical protein [Marinicrinis sediminis]|uniref:Uncharacterized protein n=1 Tax=Marinicrinis sediminis TaxID=1652465 RepID=A0ABW5RCE3_9BACL